MGASTMGNGPPGGGPARRLWVFLLICSCALHARAVTPPPGVFYKTPSSIRSSSSCSSVVYYRGTRIGESTLYFLTEQVWDLERAVVYSPELEGCVQCSADRYFSIRPGEERFYAPAQCLLCGDGLMQDPAGTGCTYTTDQCLPPLVRTKGGICSCPPFTDLKPGNYCGCADPIAQTEYDTYDNVICLCPPETKFVNGQCLCPRPDQVYDPEHRWCKACPHPLVAVSRTLQLPHAIASKLWSTTSHIGNAMHITSNMNIVSYALIPRICLRPGWFDMVTWKSSARTPIIKFILKLSLHHLLIKRSNLSELRHKPGTKPHSLHCVCLRFALKFTSSFVLSLHVRTGIAACIGGSHIWRRVAPCLLAHGFTTNMS